MFDFLEGEELIFANKYLAPLLKPLHGDTDLTTDFLYVENSKARNQTNIINNELSGYR